MKHSIISKVSVPITLTLLIILSSIGYYIYNSEVKTITKLQNTQKTYIVTQLNRSEKKAIKSEKMVVDELSLSILGAIKESLYNVDIDVTKHILNNFMQHDSIKAVYIYDSISKAKFLAAYKKNNNILEFKANTPEKFKQLLSYQYDLNADGQNIGYIKVYYDLSVIKKEIIILKQNDLNKFNKESNKVNEEVKEELIIQTIALLVATLIIIFIIIYLLKNIVNKPLIEFQYGLKSFFDYLADPSKEVNSININTKDEFGQMTKSVNKSIKISMKMHGEMAQLINTMDTNVITSETNEKGIITYVSQAFCKISGYTKEELIGHSHNMVRHIDMPKEIFEEIWDTLKDNRIWEGDIKNLRKDGSFYWVHTIISPKCTKAGENCGYTAIRYDITDKKKVEELTANLEIKIEERTIDLHIAKKQIEAILKHTKESIEYAALIQSSLVPDNNIFRQYFQEYFVIWHPKDTVGGDIYLFNELKDKDECLIMCIDCTGHGVPGAFVTMLVKAVEAQLMAEIYNNPDMEISTAWIMGYYNKALKKMLKQDQPDCVSNVGWDGSVLYYNKKEKIIKFSGAESPFFYRKPDGEIVTVKGTRKSVGYKQCPMDYEYKEAIIENIEEGTKVFLTTDGYLDQNGGPKDFPFGKKKFTKIIDDYGEESMSDLQEMFLYEMAEWEEQIENNDRNDDMTVIGFTI